MSALLHSYRTGEVLGAREEGHPMRMASHCPASALVSGRMRATPIVVPVRDR